MRQPAAGAMYWETVAHGLFHLLAIIIAFVIGNAWVSREAELKDLRDVKSVFVQLNQDIQSARRNIDARVKGAQCADIWTESDLGFPTWRAINGRQTVYWSLMRQDPNLVGDIESFYSTKLPRFLGLARRDCSFALASLQSGLAQLSDKMNGRKDDKGKVVTLGSMGALDKQSQDLATTTFWRVVGLTLAGAATVFILPPALRTLEVVFRTAEHALRKVGRHTAGMWYRLRLAAIASVAKAQGDSVEKAGVHVAREKDVHDSAGDVEPP